jgi:hypothetical protein
MVLRCRMSFGIRQCMARTCYAVVSGSRQDVATMIVRTFNCDDNLKACDRHKGLEIAVRLSTL